MLVDVSHDFCFILVDYNLFVFHSISVYQRTSCIVALLSCFIHSTAHLLGKLCGIVFGVAFKHRFKNDAFGGVRDVLCCGYKLHAIVLQGFLMYGGIILVSRKAVKLIDQNVIPLTLCAVLDHALKVCSVIIRTRHSPINIGVKDQNIMASCVFLTYAELSFNGLLSLVITGITCINYCCFHFVFSLFCFILSFDRSDQNGNSGSVKGKR